VSGRAARVPVEPPRLGSNSETCFRWRQALRHADGRRRLMPCTACTIMNNEINRTPSHTISVTMIPALSCWRGRSAEGCQRVWVTQTLEAMDNLTAIVARNNVSAQVSCPDRGVLTRLRDRDNARSGKQMGHLKGVSGSRKAPDVGDDPLCERVHAVTEILAIAAMEGDAAQRHVRGRQPVGLPLRHVLIEDQFHGVPEHHGPPPSAKDQESSISWVNLSVTQA